MKVGKYKIPNRTIAELDTRFIERQKILISTIYSIIECVATDGAEITPELQQSARFVLKNWNHKE